MFITLWHGDHDLRRDRSQMVPTEIKTGPTYVKQSIGLLLTVTHALHFFFYAKSILSLGRITASQLKGIGQFRY